MALPAENSFFWENGEFFCYEIWHAVFEGHNEQTPGRVSTERPKQPCSELLP